MRMIIKHGYQRLNIMKQNNKILVTGSQGFIGTHLMKELGEDGIGYDIIDGYDILDKYQFRNIVKNCKPSFIVHLAAVSNGKQADRDPDSAVGVNIVGTFNVLSIAKEYKIPVLIASSAATVEPEMSWYASTKDCMERIAKMFDNVIIARFYNVYGLGSKSVVNKFVKAAKRGKKVTLNGNTTRDYIHVSDIVDLILWARTYIKTLNGIDPITLDFGTGKQTSLSKLVTTVEKEVKKGLLIEQGKPIKEIQRSCATDGVMGKEYIPLKEGIRSLL